MRLRQILINFVLLGVSIGTCLGIMEIALRLSGSSWEVQRQLYATPPAAIRYQSTPTGLYFLAPGQRGQHTSSCFDTSPVSTTEHGFRGSADHESPEVIVLGDSFVEALQIPDGLTAAELLEDRIGRPIINAGVSGYATTHALQAWRERLAPLKPRLLVLFVYLGNDISGNACALSQTLPPCGRLEDGKVRFLPKSSLVASGDPTAGGPEASVSSGGDKFRVFLRAHLALYALAHDLRVMLRGAVAELDGHVDRRWGLYRENMPPEWHEAWLVTEAALAALKQETDVAGTKLVLVSIPEYIALSTNPARLIRFGTGSSFPKDFDSGLPSRRLMEIAQRLDIPALDLLPIMTRYRDKFTLKPPYFSFSCDGHWNPLGHALAANALAAFLEQRRLIPAAKGVGNDETAPQRVLGQSAFDQIFFGEIYKP